MSRAMKDSGIYDGVEIPISWDTMKFGKVCSVVTDFVASGSFADLRENVPYLSEPDYAMLVRTTDLAKTARSEGKVYISKASYEFLSNSNLFGGEIVLPNIGSIGDVYVVPKLYDRMSLAPNSIMFKTNYCDKYYYYYFLSKVGGIQLSEISQSTAMAKFNKTDLKQIRVFLPSLAEQQRIASFLDRKCSEIDEMIALQEQIIEELKAYKQSVITEAVTKGLNPDVPMKDSGIEWIGQIPEHWEVKPIKYIKSKEKNSFADGPFGSNLKSEHFVENGDVLVIESGFITTGKFIYKDFKTITKEHFETIKRSECKAKDIIIAKIGANYGMSGELPVLDKPSVVSGNSLKITLDNKKYLNPIFVYAMMTAKSNKGFLDLVQENAQPALSLSGLNNFRLPSAPIEEQQAIADYLDEKCADIDSLIQTKQSKIDSLKEYKKSIIYEYVTGKREVE